jgi:hypothetical protein
MCLWVLLLQVRLFESVNFLDFAQLLAAFSDRASYEDKVKFIFWVYDVDGDGEWPQRGGHRRGGGVVG